MNEDPPSDPLAHFAAPGTREAAVKTLERARLMATAEFPHDNPEQILALLKRAFEAANYAPEVLTPEALVARIREMKSQQR